MIVILNLANDIVKLHYGIFMKKMVKVHYFSSLSHKVSYPTKNQNQDSLRSYGATKKHSYIHNYYPANRYTNILCILCTIWWIPKWTSKDWRNFVPSWVNCRTKCYIVRFTLTKYEVQGGSLHCDKYAVKTSADVGFNEEYAKERCFLVNIFLINEYIAFHSFFIQ